MATDVTLREKKLAALMERVKRDCTVLRVQAPGVVELVEAGKCDTGEAVALMEQLLGPHVGRLDALVLGCTHYPFASAAIRRCLGPRVVLLDGGEGTARETMRRLGEADLLRDGVGEVLWHNSAKEEKLLELSQKLLNQP
jgi:glutamate racemase